MATVGTKGRLTYDHIHTFFSPALALMNRLAYPRKFAIISLVFALPLVLVMYLLISEINERIDFAQQELDGLAYLRPLRQLFEHVPQAKLLARSYAQGEIVMRPELIRKQAAIEADMAHLASAEQRLGPHLRTTGKFTVLQENWAFLRQQTLHLTASDNAHLYTQLLMDIQALLLHVGDTSNLILDPDIDTYYLMDSILLKLPEGQGLMARMRFLGADLVARQSLSTEAHAQLLMLTGLLQSNLQATQKGLETALRTPSGARLALSLAVPLQTVIDAVTAFLHTLQRDFIKAETLPNDPTLYLTSSTKALDASFILWERSANELERLLQARMDRFAQKRTLVTLFVALILLLVIYLWMAFYLAVMRTVAHLESAAHRMVHGDMAEMAPLETRDELGQVVTSFNTVASSLRKEWAQAREESARASAAETLLRESEARLRLIIDTALDAVIVMDAQSCILTWNPQATAMFGWSQDEAVGRSLTDTIIPLQYREAHVCGVQRFLALGEGPVLNTRIEITALHRDGHEFPVELAVAPAPAGGGQHTFSAFIRDITARKRAEEELHQAKDAAEVASQAKSEFLANMSHELRTPLNAIIGFSEVLLEKMFGELNTRQEDYLRDVLGSGQHLLSLINDILDLAKVEAGKMELELSIFDLRQVLEGSLVMVKERAQTHGVRLGLDIDPALSSLLGDERKVKQILFNLLSNAVKFTPKGGQVGIRAQMVDHAVEVAVWDTGVGIAPEDQQHIFAAFQQVQQARAGKSEGTGLGLTLTRQMIELHGGRIWVDSTPGQGSTFTFTLPLTGVAADPELPALRSDEPAFAQEDETSTGAVVLVIEDDPRAVDLLRIYLREAGYRLDLARDGAEGLAKIAQRRPDAIILDVLLPQMDGWTFLAHIKTDAATKDVPVIVVSIVDQREKGFALGAAEYLIKPIQKDALLQSLQSFGLQTSKSLTQSG
jgi:PAS domain S-box-containing protein